MPNKRGRPRLWPNREIAERMRRDDLTRRTAQNRLLYEFAAISLENAPEWVQRFYLGGRTVTETCGSAPRSERIKIGLLQELGRWPADEIAGVAEEFATACPESMSMHEAVRRLRALRLAFYQGMHAGPESAGLISRPDSS